MRAFRRLALKTSQIVGSTRAFALALVLVATWVVVGFFARWSDAWLLWPSAIASVVTFVIVFSLQYTQNRDTRAIHLKLDEILRGSDQTRTHLVKLERLSDEDLGAIEQEIVELREQDER